MVDKDSRWGIEKMTEDLKEHVFSKLVSYGTMSWQEIMDSSGDRSTGNNSHLIEDTDIIDEVYDRLQKLGFIGFPLFSLRLTAKKRLWHIFENRIFKII